MRSIRTQVMLCKRLQLGLLVAAVVILAGFYLVWYRPAANRLKQLNDSISGIQTQLRQNQDQVIRLPVVASEARRLELALNEFPRRFPSQPELGQFIREITQISEQLALQEWKYQPMAPRRTPMYFEMPIQMSFRGNYLDAASFLRQVEQMQRLTRMQRLSIRGKDARTGAVEVEMAMNIYFSEG